MIIQMEVGLAADTEEVRRVMREAQDYGLIAIPQENQGTNFCIVQIHLQDGKTKARTIPEFAFCNLPGVANIIRVTPSAISISANGTGKSHCIKLGSSSIGHGFPCQLIAGPCTVDQHIDKIIGRLVEMGITYIRGGCWKPRSDPFSFPGFGKKGVRWLLEAAKNHNVEAVFTEVIDSTHISDIEKIQKETGYEGKIVLWVGARPSNPTLMQKLSRQKQFPVMVKNGIRDRSVAEWVARAEPLLVGEKHWDEDGQFIEALSLGQGNDQILLCLRGVENTDPQSTFRFAPNHEWISVARARKYWAPIGVDPSHSAGTMENDLVILNLESALVHKPDFVLLETYFDPHEGKALCDAKQAVPLSRMAEVQKIVASHNKKIR